MTQEKYTDGEKRKDKYKDRNNLKQKRKDGYYRTHSEKMRNSVVKCNKKNKERMEYNEEMYKTMTEENKEFWFGQEVYSSFKNVKYCLELPTFQNGYTIGLHPNDYSILQDLLNMEIDYNNVVALFEIFFVTIKRFKFYEELRKEFLIKYGNKDK